MIKLFLKKFAVKPFLKKVVITPLPGFSIKPFLKRFAIKPFLKRFAFLIKLFLKKFVITPASRSKKKFGKLALLSGAKRAPCCFDYIATKEKSKIFLLPRRNSGAETEAVLPRQDSGCRAATMLNCNSLLERSETDFVLLYLQCNSKKIEDFL